MSIFSSGGEGGGAKKTVTVGWFMNDTEASLIYDDPKLVDSPKMEHATNRAVQHCPGIIDIEKRLYYIACPFDVILQLKQRSDGKPYVADLTNAAGGLSTEALKRLTHIMPPETWRHPNRPVIQIVTPYRFISDDHVYMNQLPPYTTYYEDPWPGLVMAGRMPIDVWPRSIMWAFEWYDTSKPIVLHRGDPWFYAGFDAVGPETSVRMVKAKITPELKRYCQGLDNVTSYVNKTWTLFSLARKRRPKKLLIEEK